MTHRLAKTRLGAPIALVSLLAVPVLGQLVSYEAKSFPEQNGWKRNQRLHGPVG